MKAHFVTFMVPLKLQNIFWTRKKYVWMMGHIAQSMVGFPLQMLMKSIWMKVQNVASMVVTNVENCRDAKEHDHNKYHDMMVLSKSTSKVSIKYHDRITTQKKTMVLV